MALSTEQQRIIAEAKDKLRVMSQVPRLEKEITSLQKKLEIKENKMSDLIKLLDD